MEKQFKHTLEIRVYTGNGYEDFKIGEFVRGSHIFGSGERKKVTDILIYGKTMENICIGFEDGEEFEYTGLKYRHTGLLDHLSV